LDQHNISIDSTSNVQYNPIIHFLIIQDEDIELDPWHRNPKLISNLKQT